MGDTTWRLKAVEGHGWVERVDPGGGITVTADPRQARQYDTFERARADLDRLRPDLVPVRAVAGPAFSRRVHGQPSPRRGQP